MSQTKNERVDHSISEPLKQSIARFINQASIERRIWLIYSSNLSIKLHTYVYVRKYRPSRPIGAWGAQQGWP